MCQNQTMSSQSDSTFAGVIGLLEQDVANLTEVKTHSKVAHGHSCKQCGRGDVEELKCNDGKLLKCEYFS